MTRNSTQTKYNS